MKRCLRLQHAMELPRLDPRSWAICVLIDSTEIVPLSCELMILSLGKAKKLSLLFEDDKKLTLAVADQDSGVAETNQHAIAITLSPRHLEWLLNFLMTWYRDGIAVVDHLDIELSGDRSADDDCTLVIKADNSRTPIPGDQLKSILANYDD